MAWFWTIIQLLIRLSASFWSFGMKMLHGIWYKLEDWIKRYLIQTYQRLFQKYFKSYRIALGVALWLDFEQLSSYLFISRCFVRAAISKCYMEFDTKLEDWINRYLIQTYQRLSQEYFKSYRITFRVALWLDFEQLSSYLFVYRRLFRVTISKCYMEFDTNWRIEWRDILFKLTTGYLKCISSHKPKLLGWLCGLILNKYPFTYSFHSVFFELRYENVTWNLIQNWRIESTDMLFKLTTGYLKSISSFKEELLGWLYGLLSNNYPVTYSFIGFFLYLRRKKITWNLSRNWRIESTDILLKLGKGYFKSISSHIE